MNNFIKYLPYFIIVILLLTTVNTCKKSHDLTNDMKKYSNYRDTVMFYKNKAGNAIAYNTILEIDYKALQAVNSALVKKVDSLGLVKPKSITIIKDKVSIDTVYIPFDTPILDNPFSKPFSVDNLHYSIGGVTTNNGITLDSIRIYNESSIIVGQKKLGLFKKKEYIVTVTNSNPYIITEGIQNYTFKEKKPFHDKLWFKGVLFVGGFFTGYVVGNIN